MKLGAKKKNTIKSFVGKETKLLSEQPNIFINFNGFIVKHIRLEISRSIATSNVHNEKNSRIFSEKLAQFSFIPIVIKQY